MTAPVDLGRGFFCCKIYYRIFCFYYIKHYICLVDVKITAMRYLFLICSLLGFLNGINGQNWPKFYDIQNNLSPRDLAEAYDGGFLIGCIFGGGGSQYNGLLIKTDVNGSVLWEKQLGDVVGDWDIRKIVPTADGGFLIVGSCDSLDTEKDPFLMKLNACGLIDWCRIFKTQGKSDFGIDGELLDDGSYILLCANYELPTTAFDEFISLIHMSSDGSLLWEQHYYQSNTFNSHIGSPSDVFVTTDGNFLITGSSNDPYYGPDLPLLILADSTGALQWELLWGFNPVWPNMLLRGGGYQSLSMNGQFYSVINNGRSNSDQFQPCLLKTSVQGDEISYTDLVPDCYAGEALKILKLDEARFLIGLDYRKPRDSSYQTIMQLDTSGNILGEKLLNRHTDTHMNFIHTRDGKFVYVDSRFLNYRVTEFWKFNENWEEDSLYLTPRKYDTLCPFPITSSILSSECFVTSLTELAVGGDLVKMHLFPNPARTEIHVRLPACIQRTSQTGSIIVTTAFYYHDQPFTLRIFNAMGKMITSKEVEADVSEITVEAGQWPAGCYFFQLEYDSDIIATERVVVQ